MLRPFVVLALAALVSIAAPRPADAAAAAVAWTQPSAYTDGTPLTASAIAGFEIQCSSLAPTGGTKGTCPAAPVSLSGAVSSGSITVTIPAGGAEACFQVRTRATSGTVSAWSAEACRTFAAAVPNAPTNVTVAVVVGVSVSPAFGVTSSGARSSTVVGFVRLGEPCAGPSLFTYRGQAYRRVDPARVTWWATKPSPNVAAACS